ncbi:helix-turn-helix domain-containing protein [Sporosarcina sp. USHLN248]|uniref:helix-turn-helix domain-containing protein n=1 Tax=Sporosarcina sp. USHLN248 TaxID=3081300 RepID=UPI003019BE32
MEKNILTVKELRSDFFRNEVSLGTIYSMVREEQIPSVHVRGKVLFHRETIERWFINGGTKSLNK